MAPEDPSTGTITALLRQARAGRQDALDALFERVYGDLRSIARAELRSRRGLAPDLDGTALVHAACARLLGRDQLRAEDRKHFFFVLARAMHDALVEEARSQLSAKRGGRHRRVSLTEAESAGDPVGWDPIDLQQALAELRERDPEGAQLVDLRFFAGRTLEETAELMGTSVAVVRRNWAYVKAWLGERLGRKADRPGPAA